MDRPEPGLIKWSPIAGHDRFIHINLQHRVVQLYEPNGFANNGRFEYKQLCKHDNFPALTTYDWSPALPGLLAVGGQNGGVNLLRIDDNSNDCIELGLKMTRMCQAVSFNTQGRLAVGLERVRLDQSLHIWDVSRLASMSKSVKGFPKDIVPFAEPLLRLEPTASISSVKFFEDSPETLVIGLKAQGLRLYDLRDPTGSLAIQYSTRCNNNLAIDYADQNYFASSALDQPGVFVWDRRATGRPVASPAYLQAIDEEDVSWGGALCLWDAVKNDEEPSLTDSKHSLVRSLRYCRDRRGLLAVLTRTGQLKVMQTDKEPTPPQDRLAGSPELLQVQRSYEMDVHFSDPKRKNERIVSFDWVTLPYPSLQPRLLVLRANGSLEILEQPSCASDHLYKLTPWQAPHRGLDEGASYHDLMRFEPSQCTQMYGPLLVEQALADVPIFGPDKANVSFMIEKTLQSPSSEADIQLARPLHPDPLLSTPMGDRPIAERLRVTRKTLRLHNKTRHSEAGGMETAVDGLNDRLQDSSISPDRPASCSQMHEELLSILPQAEQLSSEVQSDVDHVMLLRAKERYLLDPVRNRNVVSDDLWLRYLWDWVAGAEAAAEDSGMKLSPLDLSYMGVATIWANDLGRHPWTRLPDGVQSPEAIIWEKCIGSICKKRRLPKYQGVPTKRPFHRQLCLDICTWGDATRHEADESEPKEAGDDYPAAKHTMETARALFRGDMDAAVQILKKASTTHPELLFVSLALQLIGRGNRRLAKEQLDFDEAVASKTDPYLRAISSLIATGDWTAIANQASLPLSDRAYVAVRNMDDERLTQWIQEQVSVAMKTGDIEGIVLTGITDQMVDIFANYVGKSNDVQTATLIMSICAPRYIDDYRCLAWRNAYRAYLQRHKAFYLRTKFEVESTKRSKRDGRPTIKPPSRQIALRCVYCDAETTLPSSHTGSTSGHPPGVGAPDTRNPLMVTGINAGVSCPNCGRHLPRCVVCLEVVGIPRSDRPEAAADMDTRMAARFPTFCLKCEHVMHLDHARQWFARHVECPVPECRCQCNFRANPELNYH
ncbi:WD repeat domain-containing protein [Sodiomyces alkalinus F11]|uniref:WD repeat domain-containing protein n=1 Tax=Sodiomyces alkalinus (strain CBS 110278 / VKM F-3762 / F11) TaxID=1314773 RepID=A0A3N2PMM0_SODAK|nr:WD repeat domain-containing protein [Sodiomyces alkalinus F11]ROT35719.1 WD repeat domain-containing protein [Sodiomyces alkalinus F11]